MWLMHINNCKRFILFVIVVFYFELFFHCSIWPWVTNDPANNVTAFKHCWRSIGPTIHFHCLLVDFRFTNGLWRPNDDTDDGRHTLLSVNKSVLYRFHSCCWTRTKSFAIYIFSYLLTRIYAASLVPAQQNKSPVLFVIHIPSFMTLSNYSLMDCSSAQQEQTKASTKIEVGLMFQRSIWI